MMRRGTLSRLGCMVGIILSMAAGCTQESDTSPPTDTPISFGSARIDIISTRVSAGEVTRVTIESTSGHAAELARNDQTGSFSGALVLPVGPTELIGRAFIDGTLVAESQPVPVEIQEGIVTSVSIRLLDLTGGDDADHGPFVLSLVHPATTVANQPVALSVTAVDPDGDALTFAWSDDCADSTFSDAQAAATEWVKTTAGACRLSLTVSAGDLSVTEAFSLVAFEETSATGAVSVDGVIVSAPRVVLQLHYSSYCEVFTGIQNASCADAIAAPAVAFVSAFVDWGNAAPGTFAISDDCGGTFLPFSEENPFFAEGEWTPPSAQSVCLITAQATSADGVSGKISAALLVQAGASPPPPPPPPPSTYTRASLRPLYQLTPQSEFGRFEILGRTMRASDFQSFATTTSVEQKLNELGAQIGFERGTGILDLFIDAENRSRAALIPFRGKPTDVKLLAINGQRKVYVPLGGTFSTPGNEVAVVNLDNGVVQRIRAGIRPQRVAVHEGSGLVFVCNQLSNYISIIDARFDELLASGGTPVEIATDFYCTDLALVERDPALGETDELFLYVANTWRGSVLKYSIDIVRDINDDPEDVQITPVPGQPAHEPLAEIAGVGENPSRLRLDDAQSRIYVANRRGGELSIFRISDDTVESRIALNAPTADVVQIADKVYVPTTTPFRGLLNANAIVPDAVDGNPVKMTGVDGQRHEVHPGALFDQTDSYGFEDVRNGIFQINTNLTGTPSYHTDDSEADNLFANAQKVLAGALPMAIVRSAAGNKVYVALAGSDVIQELDVVTGELRLRSSGLTFQTRERPVALALDEANQQLVSVSWGGEVMEVFDLLTGTRLSAIDLGYAQPAYPATTIEAGEYFFNTAKWSNDGRKACASCHFDEGLTDGIGFSNGTVAPTAYHQVKPTWNLANQDRYFWNGSFVNGSQASLAFAAQARTNCELVLYGLVEGPSSDPAQRIGDPNNYTANAAQDSLCRPNTAFLIDGLPGNLNGQDFVNGIQPIIDQQKALAGDFVAQSMAEQLLRAGLDITRDDVIRSIDYYSVAELRLPPNPLSEMRSLGMLEPAREDRLVNGEQIFRGVADCASCHDPDNSRHPFTDGRAHGRGSNWIMSFVITYAQDPELLAILPSGIPDQMLFSADVPTTTQEVNFHYNPLDFFTPFCFDDTSCLRFEDPLAVRGQAAEGERLRRLTIMNLADPDRGFLPGQVVGQARVSTPSLRGVWFLNNLLRHGHANSVREAVLPPGHQALADGERGWAVDARGNFDVHGSTQALTPEEVEDLVFYVQSIE